MSIFDTNGHCRRYHLRADSEDPWVYTLEPIDDAYFRQDWYFLRGTWVTRVNSLLVRNFQEALTAIAYDYLEWFEDIFLEHSRATRKRISYLGAVGGAGGRDLGNKVYSVVISAAFQIRAQRGLRELQCSHITSIIGRGDMVETLLGCLWQYEHINGTITKELMWARTALEAACLGVERLWDDNYPWIVPQQTLVQAALTVPDFPVNVPEPGARSYHLQDADWEWQQIRREHRNIFQLALGRQFGDLVRHCINSYL